MKPNDWVIMLLRSPLRGMLGPTMLITVRGRRTGHPITVPVSYAEQGSELWILSSRRRNWWRNISVDTPVSLYLHGQDRRALATLVTDPAMIETELLQYTRLLPGAARSLGLVQPNAASARAAQLSTERLFVRVCLQ